MTLQTSENAKKGKVRQVYTLDQVMESVAKIYESKPSLRRIAKEDFGGKVTFGDVQRILNGIEPASPQKRAVFGLPEYQLAPVCLKCGLVHVTKRCTGRTGTGTGSTSQPGDEDEPLKKRKKPTPYEHRMQRSLIRSLRSFRDEYPELRWVFAVPNGGHRRKVVAAKMKAEGQNRGVPDLWLPVKRHSFSGLVIELKYGDNQPTEDQKQWLAHLEGEDFLAILLNDIDLALEIFTAYVSRSGTSHKGHDLWDLVPNDPERVEI